MCESLDVENKITSMINNQSIYQYDQIFITDIWLEHPRIIQNDPWLKRHTLLIDHHESALKVPNFENYSFMNIRIKDENGRCSGTSLFYEYLLVNGSIEATPALDQFVELTRLYDTWEWVTVKDEPAAASLTTLFNIVGPDNYVEMMLQKLLDNNLSFNFNTFENNLIAAQNKETQEKLKKYAEHIYIREVSGLKAGIAFVNFSLRNEFAQYLRNINYPIDFVMMVSLENRTITYRYINKEVKVLEIAESFGGKGHDYAASSPIRKRKMNSLIDEILQK